MVTLQTDSCWMSMNAQKDGEGKEEKGGVYTEYIWNENNFDFHKNLFFLPSPFFNILMVTNYQVINIFMTIYGNRKGRGGFPPHKP